MVHDLLVQDDLKLLDDGGDIPQILRKRLAVQFPDVKSLPYWTETWRWHVGILSQIKKILYMTYLIIY